MFLDVFRICRPSLVCCPAISIDFCRSGVLFRNTLGPADSIVDLLLSIRYDAKQSISTIYSHLRQSSQSPPAVINARNRWQSELGGELSDEYWQEVLLNIHTSSICARRGLIQAKVVFRAHYTRFRLMVLQTPVLDVEFPRRITSTRLCHAPV